MLRVAKTRTGYVINQTA